MNHYIVAHAYGKPYIIPARNLGCMIFHLRLKSFHLRWECVCVCVCVCIVVPTEMETCVGILCVASMLCRKQDIKQNGGCYYYYNILLL